MKFTSTILSASLLGYATASPLGLHRHRSVHRRVNNIHKREVPQEHSHDLFLTITNDALKLENPKGIVDAVFGLLGNGAAAAGAGEVTNLDCLKQETADQAYTNAKAAGDLKGMAGALLYQAIERNTGSVGAASVLCTDAAVNPEIAALTQHQDPASENAGATNKAITLELAKQLASIGADPNLALLSGTFAPGEIGDPTAAGNTCDDPDPTLGCIFSQNLLVLDASQDEITAAVADVAQTFTGTGGIFATDLVDLATFSTAAVTGAVDLGTVVDGASGAVKTGAVDTTAAAAVTTTAAAVSTGADGCPIESPALVTAAPAVTTSTCSVITTTVAADSTKAVLATATSATIAEATDAAGSATNIQTFTGTLGGAAPAVESSTGDRPFLVNGNTFVGADAAIGRSCDIQHNACFNAVNSGELAGGTAQCEQQVTDCRAAGSSQKKRQASDFGSCSDPSILFTDGLADRQGSAFVPANTGDFNHGSALNIAVIAGFICQQLSDSCKAGTAVQASCATASSAAVAANQDQTAADAFNDALGVGSGAGGAADVTAPAAVETAAATATVSSVVMTITQCS